MRAGLARALQYKSYGLGFDDRASWGGARNFADRVSPYLSERQVRGLIDAAAYAAATGRPFNRHWTVHYERAEIPDSEGATFVTRLLSAVRRSLKKQGVEQAAIWVRENGPGKGGHVHILMHIPAAINLRNMTRRWIVSAGGTYRRKVSKMRSIARRLDRAEHDPDLYWSNAEAVLAYVLKAANPLVGEAMELPRCGRGGEVIGKRAGWTQNIGQAARTVQSRSTWFSGKAELY